LIAVGNGLVLWQFQSARLQTNRLTSAQQQLSAAFQLQVNLLSFHQTLRDLSESTNARRLSAETAALRKTLSDEGLHIKTTLASLPANTPVDPALLPIMESIQATLPAQLEAINALTLSDDWTTIQRPLRDELPPLERQTSELVVRIDQRAREELAQAQARMRRVQNTVLIIVPATAIGSFVVAAILGWSVVRRIVELRLEDPRQRADANRARSARYAAPELPGCPAPFSGAAIVLPDRPTEAKQALEHAIDEAAHAITEGGTPSTTCARPAGRPTIWRWPSARSGKSSPPCHLTGRQRRLLSMCRSKAQRAICIPSSAMRCTGSLVKRSATHFATRTRAASRWRSATTSGVFACGYATTVGVFSRRCWRETVLDISVYRHARARRSHRRSPHVWSEGGLGTEIELTIPAGAAYVRSRPRSSLFAGRTGAYL
jgi:hypothetical protein